ncbi:MAG: DUF4294 domain-containing protein [Chitinophagia bacterium]|nr:DUF4294 domain-containing protein [Chitinophagia bacterium]
MKHHTLLALVLVAIAGVSYAQGSLDTNKIYALQEVQIVGHRIDENARYQHNQTKYYVTKILPYLKVATETFAAIDAKENDPNLSNKDKRRFVKELQSHLQSEFTDKLKDLNVTQGELLMKLIARQTHSSVYSKLTQYKNSFVAVKWQLWARLNGLNLKKEYNPQEEADLESIMNELGYPLPTSYK